MAPMVEAAPHEPIALRPGDVLLVVDVQHDFLPGGALGVVDGDRVIGPVNRAIERFAGRPVLLTRDWHPPGHCSFRAQGGPWPPHCVAGSRGAEFSDELKIPPGTGVVSKATQVDRDAYSAFAGTDLDLRLRALNAKRLFIAGLATDYCVVNTVVDAVAAGFEPVVLLDGIAAVDVRPGDGERAIERMRELGARFAVSTDLA
jgi:nicotinamidase/pyrazinamidase